GQLNCRCSDTAPSPMDQQSFARLQLSTLKDIVPHRKYGFGQARSVNKIDMFGQRQAVTSVDRDVLGIPPSRNQGTDPVSRSPVLHAPAAGFYDPGYLQSGNIGYYPRRRGIMALTLKNIRAVDAGCVYT